MKEEIRSKIKAIRNSISVEMRQNKSKNIVETLISVLESMMVDKGAYEKMGVYLSLIHI